MRWHAAAAFLLFNLVANPVLASPMSIAVRQVQTDYRAVLMEQVCARHVAGEKDRALGDQVRRLHRAIRRGEAEGLAPALRKTEKDWDYFQSVADWVCGRGAGVEMFRAAIDRLERSITAAIRVRG